MFNSDRCVRVEHFFGSPPKVFSVGLSPVPVCFGVLRELMQHSLGGCGVLKREIGCTSRGECRSPPTLRGKSFPLSWKYCYPLPAGFVVLKCGIECTSRGEYCSPSFPSGFPPPLGKSSLLLKCGICFSSFLIEFESRIEIIKRQTILTERRSRGEEGDSTRTKPVST